MLAPNLNWCNSTRFDVAVYDDGSGPAIYHAGTTNGVIGAHLSRFDGTTYTPLGDDLLEVRALCVNTLNTPPSLFVGSFTGTLTVPAAGMLTYDFALGNYTPFAPIGGPSADLFAGVVTGDSFNDYLTRARVADLATFDLDGAGPQSASTIALGNFSAMGSVQVDQIAAHNGSTWSNVGRVGIPSDLDLNSLTVIPGATGDELIATTLTNYGRAEAQNAGVFRYNAGTWQVLGSPAGFTTGTGPGSVGYINTLLSANFGPGNELYALGRFQFVDGAATPGFVKWNGSAWVSVGGGIVSDSGPYSGVVFNDGSGPAIFLAGNSMKIGSSPDYVTGIFKWNGTTWTNVSAGLAGGSLFVFNGELWAEAGGLDTAGSLYRWNGSTWTLQSTAPAHEMTRFIGVSNTGNGDRVYYCTFSSSVNNWGVAVLEFDGTTWRELPDMGRFTMNWPSMVYGNNLNGDHSLWFLGTTGVGGEINPTTHETIDAMDSWSIARWYCAAMTCPADFNGDGFVTGEDFDAYVLAFELGEITADFDHDGFVTGDDFDVYVLAFEAGC